MYILLLNVELLCFWNELYFFFACFSNFFDWELLRTCHHQITFYRIFIFVFVSLRSEIPTSFCCVCMAVFLNFESYVTVTNKAF